MKLKTCLQFVVMVAMLGVFGCDRQTHDRAEIQLVDSPAGTTDPFEGVEQASVLLLGTFHFDDPELDSYKPEISWDPPTDEHQAEIDEIIELLGLYRPSRIAVEWDSNRQQKLDAAYDAWLEGRVSLGSSESQQIGFRLARKLAHPTVHAVDVSGRSYFPDMTEEEYERRLSEAMGEADPALVQRQIDLEERYNATYRLDESVKVTLPLREYLLRANEPEQIASGHGHYLIGSFYLGKDDDYLGPDMKTEWYNRNLRIFRNIQRVSSEPGERIVLIIGSGHLPILRQAVTASPEYKLVEVGEYLGQRGTTR